MEFQKIFTKRYYRLSKKGNQLLKTEINEKDLSRAKLAFLIGITESYLDHLVRNDRNFREDQLQKILPFLSPNFSSNYLFPQNTIHGKFITLPKRSSSELMQIVGYFLGDGNLQKRSLRFKDTSKEVLKVYRGLIKKVFNVKGRIVPQKETIAYLLEINSFYLKNWLKENVVSRKKEFLEEIRQLSKKEMTAFLRGIFDAEGSVNLTSRQVNLRLTDEKIVRACQDLLLRLGITTSFCKINTRNQNWKDCYCSYFSNRASSGKFRNMVGFSSREKSKKLELLASRINKKKIN